MRTSELTRSGRAWATRIAVSAERHPTSARGPSISCSRAIATSLAWLAIAEGLGRRVGVAVARQVDRDQGPLQGQAPCRSVGFCAPRAGARARGSRRPRTVRSAAKPVDRDGRALTLGIGTSSSHSPRSGEEGELVVGVTLTLHRRRRTRRERATPRRRRTASPSRAFRSLRVAQALRDGSSGPGCVRDGPAASRGRPGRPTTLSAAQ